MTTTSSGAAPAGAPRWSRRSSPGTGCPSPSSRSAICFKTPDARAKLEKVNPLAQVPTLVMPDGSVMSESAAITLLLADITGQDSLVPTAGAPERAAFLRWLVFIVANIYPTFTYADDPARFVSVNAARDPFRAATDAYAQRLWRQVETAARRAVVPRRALLARSTSTSR